MRGFYFRNKRILNIVLVIIFSIGFLSMAKFCYGAGVEIIDSAVIYILGGMAQLIVSICGAILSLVIDAVIKIASYDDFVNNPEIKEAWKVVRDLCNMFFILILLVIAFATILRIETYQWKKALPKLIIMAILINFSRTICGLFIDFSQVVMLTFVNAFADGGGNFISLLKVKDFLTIITDTGDKWFKDNAVDLRNTVAGIVIAVLFMIIAVITMVAVLVVFIMRVIMLWIYIVLSPLAFLLSAFPAGAKYAGQYWGEFTKYLINGPVLAFFVWLALITMGKLNVNDFTGGFTGGATEILKAENFMSFILAIGFLVGGLVVSQQIGGIGASWGAGAVKGLTGRGGALAKKVSLAPATLTGKFAKNFGGWLVDKASSGLGIDLNVARGYKRLTAQMDKHKEEREGLVRRKALETAAERGGRFRGTLAHISTGDLAWRSASNWYKGKGKVIQRIFKGGKSARRDYEKLQNLRGQRENIITTEEANEMDRTVKEKQVRLNNVNGEISNLEQGLNREKDRDKKNAIQGEIDNLNIEKATLNIDIPRMMDELVNKEVDDKKVQEIDLDITKNEKKVEKYEIEGMTEARAVSQAEMETEQGKAISHIDNSQELRKIFKEALRNKQQGLASAAFKKMARNYDYNEAMVHMGLGTDRKGLQELAGRLHKQGGFSEQAALGLIGEVGNITKQIGHFAAFGAVKLQDGKWRKTNDDEYNMMQLAEMNKLQTQNYARNVNRLGVGYYDNDLVKANRGEHSIKTWRPSRAYIAYARLNAKAFADIIKKTGNQNAAEHLAHYHDLLKENGADAVAEANKERARSGEGVDPMAAVKSIKGAEQ